MDNSQNLTQSNSFKIENTNKVTNTEANKKPRILKIVLFLSLILLLITITGISSYLITSQKKTNVEKETTADSNKDDEEDSEEKRFSSRSDPKGPYFQKMYSATSTNGIQWTISNELIFDHTSVPTAVIRDNILYLYFVDASGDYDTLSVGISLDFGETFEKYDVDFENFNEWEAVDPSAELLSDGTIRLYFYGGFNNDLENQGDDEVNWDSKTHSIYYVESQDGIKFGESYLAYQDEGLTDPDVIQKNKEWLMIINKQNHPLQLAVSSDSGKTFIFSEDLEVQSGGCCDSILINNEYYTYCMETFQKLSLYKGIENGHLENSNEKIITVSKDKEISHPAVIQLPDKSFLMYYQILEKNDSTEHDN